MLNVYLYSSQAVMEEKLSNGNVPELGLVLPADLGQRLASGRPQVLEGYVLYWVSDRDADELRATVEQEIAELVGQAVHINVAGNEVYPSPDSGGLGFTTSIALVIVLTMMGVFVVTQLVLEEKESKTMDALLISPASVGQVVAGKAVAGLFYCLTASSAVYALNAPVINQWGLTVLATFCGALFTVALGLLLGSVFEVKQQLTLWGMLLFSFLLVPVFLSIMTDLVPESAIRVMRWVPTVALSKVFTIAFSNRLSIGPVAGNLGLVVASAALIYVLLAWQVRRAQR